MTGPDLGHLLPHDQVDAVPGEDVGRVLVPLVGEHREKRMAVIDEMHLRLRGELGELMGHRRRDHLGQGAGNLDARRAAAHDHERDGAVVGPPRVPVRLFERLDDPGPQTFRIVEGVEREGVLRPPASRRSSAGIPRRGPGSPQ